MLLKTRLQIILTSITIGYCTEMGFLSPSAITPITVQHFIIAQKIRKGNVRKNT